MSVAVLKREREGQKPAPSRCAQAAAMLAHSPLSHASIPIAFCCASHRISWNISSRHRQISYLRCATRGASKRPRESKMRKERKQWAQVAGVRRQICSLTYLVRFGLLLLLRVILARVKCENRRCCGSDGWREKEKHEREGKKVGGKRKRNLRQRECEREHVGGTGQTLETRPGQTR